jgi:intracellular multiplication protein IcmB
MFDSIERFFLFLSSLIGSDADALCQLRAPIDDTTLVTESNSLVTFYRVVGSRRFIGPSEFDQQARGLVAALSALLKAGQGGRQHSVLFGFRSDPDGGEQVLRNVLGPSLSTAKRLGADAEFLFRDRLGAMVPGCVEEVALFAVYTHTSGLTPNELQRWADQRKAIASQPSKSGYMLDGAITQTPYGPPAVMLSRHHAALSTLEEKISAEGGAVRVMIDRLPCGEAISLLRRYADASAYDSRWRPQLLGQRPASTTVRRSTGTADHAMPVRIGRQLITEGYREHFGDAEMVRRGKHWYASVVLEVCPTEDPVPAFSELAASIGSHIPWQVNIELSPNGLDQVKLEKMLADFMGGAGDHNKAIKAAFRELEEMRRAGEMICALRVIFTTWALKESECVDRLSFLKSKVEGWGQATATNETGAPAHVALAGVPGFAKSLPAPYLPGPLSAFCRMAPMFRPSSIWQHGQFVPFTRDGRPYPIAFGTNLQNFWGTLVFAPTGSGKSFAMNMINAGIMFTPGATELPMVCVIDKGPSAKGVVNLAKAVLPPHLAEQVVYWRPTPSDTSYCVNPFDTQLACDRPLDADRDFLSALLGTIVPNLGPEAGKFFGKVIDVAYDMLGRNAATAKRWQWNTEKRLSEKLSSVGIEFDEAKPPRVWDVVDAFMNHGMYAEAGEAQYHAVPLLTDLSRVLQEKRIQDVYGSAPTPAGEKMTDVFNRNIIAAAGEYKLFSGVTRHKSTARFVVVDMEGLATASVSEEGRARYGLMMLFARRLGARNFFLNEDDVRKVCPERYFPYHAERIQKIGEQLKFLEYDEIHNAKGIVAVQNLLQKDAREGRKYNVTAILASQDLEDFPKDLVKNCYNFFIMGAGNAAAARELQETFDLNDSEVQTILSECTSPGKFFGMFRTTRGLLSQLLFTKVGAVEMWAYTTSKNDMAVRDALYEEFGVRTALTFLAKRFPGGSCRTYLETMRNSMGVSAGDEKGITEALLKQLRPHVLAG